MIRQVNNLSTARGILIPSAQWIRWQTEETKPAEQHLSSDQGYRSLKDASPVLRVIAYMCEHPSKKVGYSVLLVVPLAKIPVRDLSPTQRRRDRRAPTQLSCATIPHQSTATNCGWRQKNGGSLVPEPRLHMMVSHTLASYDLSTSLSEVMSHVPKAEPNTWTMEQF